MKRVGLYFGSFNPIHVGHLIIANHLANQTNLNEVWLVISPQNPFKHKESMLADYHRLALAKRAVEDNPKLRVSNIEFNLPKPSYTAHTLAHLKEAYPHIEFALVMGEDNLRSLHKWKNYEIILEKHEIYVYPRVLTEQEKEGLKERRIADEIRNHPKIYRVDAPVMKLSSTFIRKAIKARHDVRYLLTEPVHKYIEEMHFYEN